MSPRARQKRKRGAGERPAAVLRVALSWDGRVLEWEQPAGPELFRRLVARGGAGELTVRWQPVLAGGAEAPTLTGLGGLGAAHLPRSMRLELVSVRRAGGECVAHYRVRGRGR